MPARDVRRIVAERDGDARGRQRVTRGRGTDVAAVDVGTRELRRECDRCHAATAYPQHVHAEPDERRKRVLGWDEHVVA